MLRVCRKPMTLDRVIYIEGVSSYELKMLAVDIITRTNSIDLIRYGLMSKAELVSALRKHVKPENLMDDIKSLLNKTHPMH